VAGGHDLGAVEVMAATLEADHLYRFFHVGDDETLALRGVSLQLNPGEVVAVTGPSGSGKSTLMNCLAGLDEPNGGTVRIAGDRLSRRPESERARLRGRHIGIVYQHANLVGHLSVRDNVALARGLAPEAPSTKLDALLVQCGIAHRASSRPAQLSGGELARAGIAVALANDPSVLLADEPTGELDEATAGAMIALLRARAAGGKAVLIATHSDNVSGIADREIRLRDGEVQTEVGPGS
jgi:putative ABC transport system ATP-binding protein